MLDYKRRYRLRVADSEETNRKRRREKRRRDRRNGRSWSRNSIQSEIRLLDRKRVDLSPSGVLASHSYIYDAAIRYFKSWNAALAAAGIDPDKVRQRVSWSKKRIREFIHARKKANQPLGWCALNREGLGAVVAASNRHYAKPWGKVVSQTLGKS